MSRSKAVGVLGGMGPAATVDLMQRVIAATPASDDCDHIRMLVDNNPKVPSRIKALIEKTGPSPVPVLTAMAQQLVAQGADFLAMPCNTAHHFYAELASAVDVPFLNITELVAKRIAISQPAARRVGLLASSALSQIRLYEPSFDTRNIEAVYPEASQQTELMALIQAIKANGGERCGYAALQNSAEALEAAGVDCLLIACTELSVVSEQLRSALPFYDAADILAQEIVTYAATD
ncbi:aspartate/glutamate racemase family protein [Congregibacter sp.]|uniref:aspartate/glutamate racemase family protein n=1 Tax=Congregibacter sp. TaxID=2744308 RepID=UPI003F6B9401